MLEFDATKQFTVFLENGGALRDGLLAGDRVVYRDEIGDDVEGTLIEITPQSFTVEFDAGLVQDPDRDNPRFEIFRGGGIGDQLRTAFGSLLDPSFASFKTPTLQGLIRQLADFIGVDPSAIGLELTGSGDDLAIEFTLPLAPAELEFVISDAFALGAAVPGFELEASGTGSVSFDSSFSFGIGFRIGKGLAAADRFFLVEAEDPALSMTVTAQIDDPDLLGRIGLLGVRVYEDPAVPGNRGVFVAGELDVILSDPGSDADDGRITIGELADGPLPAVFGTAIDVGFHIDGLLIEANPPLSTPLPPIGVFLDGDGPGHVNELADFQSVPGGIVVGGLEPYLGFENLGFDDILSALRAVGDYLVDVALLEALETDLPLVGFSATRWISPASS